MIFYFLLYLSQEVISEYSSDSSGQLCGGVVCYTTCKRRYNNSELLTEECFSETDELFCITVGFGAIICIAICLLPTIIIAIVGKLVYKVFTGWFELIYSLIINALFGCVITGFVCMKFEGLYFCFLFGFIPWFVLCIVLRIPDMETNSHSTAEEAKYDYIKTFMKQEKQSFLEGDRNPCFKKYDPARVEFKYDQVPIDNLKELVTEALSVPPTPTLAGFVYYYDNTGNSNDWCVAEIQRRDIPYKSWEPVIVGNPERIEGPNIIYELCIYNEYDDDMNDVINPMRDEIKEIMPDSYIGFKTHPNAHAEIIDTATSPKIIGQSSKPLTIIHKLPMRLIWEFLNIFGYQLIVDIMWEYYINGNRRKIIVKKHMYNSDKGRSKSGERDRFIAEELEKVQTASSVINEDLL